MSHSEPNNIENAHKPKKGTWKRADGSIDYRHRPAPCKSYPDFRDRVDSVEDEMWWECAKSFVIALNYSACPAAWSFVVKASDFWRYRKVEDNPAAKHVTATPGFVELLACGCYGKLFERYDLGEHEYRKKYPRKWAREGFFVKRRGDVEADLVDIWSAATSFSDKALPLSQASGPDDVKEIMKRARRDLGLSKYVRAYASGVDADFLVRAITGGCKNVDAAIKAYKAGVAEEDIFAGAADAE